MCSSSLCVFFTNIYYLSLSHTHIKYAYEHIYKYRYTHMKKHNIFRSYFAQSAGAVEYTDCTSAEGGGVRPPPNECPGYDTKQSDGEVPAVLELWGMQNTPLLPSFPGPLWPGVVAPDKGPIYGLNRTNSILMLKWIE